MKMATNKRSAVTHAGTLAALFLLLSLVLSACGGNNGSNAASEHGSHNEMAMSGENNAGAANAGTGNAAAPADGAANGGTAAAEPSPQTEDGATNGNAPAATDTAPPTDDGASGGSDDAPAAEPAPSTDDGAAGGSAPAPAGDSSVGAKAGNDDGGGKSNAEPTPPKKNDDDGGKQDDDAKGDPPAASKPKPTPKPETKPATKPTPAPAETKPKTYVVEIKEFAFVTDTLTIRPGDSVKFINRDTVKHTATADDGNSFDTGLLGQDEEKIVTFDKEGEFPYHCAPHPAMQATIIVSAK